MPVELKPVVRALRLPRGSLGAVTGFHGWAGATEVVAATTGIGTRLATQVTEAVLDAFAADHLLMIGIAGAVDAHTPIGTLIVPEFVLHAPAGTEHHPVALPGTVADGGLHTSDELVTDEARLNKLRARRVLALDMETGAVGAVCERRGVPWSAVRAISDRATDDDVDDEVLGLTHPDGSANAPALARFLARNPRAISRLVRLARGTQKATAAAAEVAIRFARGDA
jgi:nucleoside phosphorylase